jgi:protein-tyrosine-phosphatase
VKTILFIGTHNVFRSKYAEAYFNHMVRKKRLPGRDNLGSKVIAISRGTYIGQGRLARFRALWADGISTDCYTPHASKLRYNDLAGADAVFGVYEEEIKPQLFYEPSTVVPRKVRGSWAPMDATEVEYWRCPNLVGTGDCLDGGEVDDPREITGIIEYNVELLVDNIENYI